MTDDAVRALLLKRAKRFAKYRGATGVIGWCHKHGVSRSHTNEFLNGKRGAATDLLDALGLEYRIVRKTRLTPSPSKDS